MTKNTLIVAPPYHVQSTAAELRSGFPYFSYHDSVSKLLSEKWRKPCQHNIYPFTDGTGEDLMWLRATFGPQQLTVFKRGGHLGNLFNPTVQKSILGALTPMRPPGPKPETPLKN